MNAIQIDIKNLIQSEHAKKILHDLGISIDDNVYLFIEIRKSFQSVIRHSLQKKIATNPKVHDNLFLAVMVKRENKYLESALSSETHQCHDQNGIEAGGESWEFPGSQSGLRVKDIKDGANIGG